MGRMCEVKFLRDDSGVTGPWAAYLFAVDSKRAVVGMVHATRVALERRGANPMHVAFGVIRDLILADQPIPEQYNGDHLAAEDLGGYAVSDWEAARLSNGEPILVGTKNDVRLHLLKLAYRCAEDNTRYLDAENREARIDPKHRKFHRDFLVDAGYLREHESAYHITAKGIDLIERSNQASRPSGLAFVVMAFQDETIALYEEAIVPAVFDAGLQPVRIDRYRQPDTITEGIRTLIRSADVIVADLSFERPNCYYEVGYAHALARPVVLSAREDHDPRRASSEWRVHFDLDSYSLIFWNDGQWDALKEKLQQAIKGELQRHDRQGPTFEV